MTYRVLVAGSRDWPYPAWIYRELAEIGQRVGCGELVVRHGASGRADWAADRYAASVDARREQRPADWEGPCRDTCRPGHRKRDSAGREYCPAAGMYRNAGMLDDGDPVDEALVFIAPCRNQACRRPRTHGSHGATGMAELAQSRGVPTRRFP